MKQKNLFIVSSTFIATLLFTVALMGIPAQVEASWWSNVTNTVASAAASIATAQSCSNGAVNGSIINAATGQVVGSFRVPPSSPSSPSSPSNPGIPSAPRQAPGSETTGNPDSSGSNNCSDYGTCTNLETGTGPSQPPYVPPEIGDITIDIDPDIVRYGESATITWNGDNASECTVTGYGITSPSGIGVTGSVTVTNMTGEATYTLNCTLGQKSKEATATVRVLPRVQET